MKQVCRIGLDIAKHKFQVHGVDKHGKDVFNKQLNRKDVLVFFANLPVISLQLIRLNKNRPELAAGIFLSDSGKMIISGSEKTPTTCGSLKIEEKIGTTPANCACARR
jgi:hypothetical protein